MTIQSLNEDTRYHLFDMLDERDLHAISRTCKPLEAEASQNDLWAPFLAKRFIEPTENNKQRLTRFFQSYCRWGYWHPKTTEIDLTKRWTTTVDRDVFDRYLSLHEFVLAWVRQGDLDHQLDVEDDSDRVRILLDSGARIFHRISHLDPSLGTLDNAIVRRAPLEKVLLLIGAGARLSQTSRNPNSLGTLDQALTHWATTQVVLALLGFGAQVSNRSLPDTGGSLDAAIQYRHPPETVSALLDARAEVYESTRELPGTLDYAIKRDNSAEVIQALINRGVRPSPTRRIGNERIPGSLSEAIRLDRSGSIIHALLQGGAPLEETVGNDLGSLDLAIERNNIPDVFQVLINAGARLSETTDAHEGSLERARRLGRPPAMIRLLEEAAVRQGIRIVENRPVADEPLVAQLGAPVPQPDPLPEVDSPPNIFLSWVSSACDAVVGFFQELGWRIARAVVKCLFGY